MEERVKQDEVEIDLKEIIALIIQNAAVIILVALCAGIYIYTSTKSKVTTSYTSSTKMYILSRNSTENTINGDSALVDSVLQDYEALVKSKEVLEEVNRKLEAENIYEVFDSQISVSAEEGNKVVTLSVTDPNPIASMKMANTIRDVMTQYMKSTMNVQLFDVVEPATVGAPSIVDKAKRNAVLVGFMAACFIIGIIVLRYLIDDSLKTPEEIESKLGLCVLATLPINNKLSSQKDKRKRKNSKSTDGNGSNIKEESNEENKD